MVDEFIYSMTAWSTSDLLKTSLSSSMVDLFSPSLAPLMSPWLPSMLPPCKAIRPESRPSTVSLLFGGEKLDGLALRALRTSSPPMQPWLTSSFDAFCRMLASAGSSAILFYIWRVLPPYPSPVKTRVTCYYSASGTA